MVFYATFNNISAILWRWFLLTEETRDQLCIRSSRAYFIPENSMSLMAFDHGTCHIVIVSQRSTHWSNVMKLILFLWS